jgi:hypothetical protein
MKLVRSVTTCVPGIMTLSIFMVFQGPTVISRAAQTRSSLQPFAQQVRQVETTLAYLGQPLTQKVALTRRAQRVAPLSSSS